MNIFAKYKDIALGICKESFDLNDDDLVNLVAEPPKESSHGDIAINAAMVLAKKIGKNPRQIAEEIKRELDNEHDIESVEIAGPGFINVRLKNSAWQEFLLHVNGQDIEYGSNDLGRGEKINVEYVSANPTGPIHIGHARNAVLGDVIANVLSKSGFDVVKEYYVNDAGVQIGVLCESAFLRYKEALGVDIGEIPEGLYPGEYLIDVGKKFADQNGDQFKNDENYPQILRSFVVDEMMELIKNDLADMGVIMDVFTSEQYLHETNKIEEAVEFLDSKGLLYRGVLEPPKGKKPEDWEPREQLLFRATEYGDDVDRPLQKSDGTYTYFASDIAYHKDKFDRGFKKMVITLGADHGGYVKRLKAVVKAMSSGEAEIEAILSQLVKLMENGEQVKMSKRAGNFITLREVLDKVGKDVLRFIMLTRKSDAGLDFDLQKVTEASKDNPVFYVQYAHARICSVNEQAKERGLIISDSPELERLSHPAEIELIRKLAEFPRVIEASALHFEPHRVTFYLYELASQFHQLWNLGKEEGLKFIDEEDEELSSARLFLVNTCKNVIVSGLTVLGVDPVEKM